MNWLTRSASYSADGEGLWRLFCRAIVTRCYTFLDDLDLAIEPSSTTFNEWDVCSQTHFVDVPSCFQIIQRIKNHCKSFKPRHIELGVLYVRMVGFELRIGIKSMCCLFRDLVTEYHEPSSPYVCPENPPMP